MPIVEKDKLVGLITSRDLRYAAHLDQSVKQVMTTKLVTATDGTSLEEAKALLHKHKIEKLPVTDGSGKLIGLITSKGHR